MAYEPPGDAIDETAATSPGARDRYAEIIGAIAERGPAELCERVQERMGREGIRFRTAHGRQPFHVDPVPRLLDDGEWSRLEAGLAQRVAALEAFIADVYSEQRIVSEGVVPERLLSTSELYDPRLRGTEVPGYVHVYGPDIVRDRSGTLLVLEDNLRTPSGIAYLLALRSALADELAPMLDGVRPLDPEVRPLAEALRLAAPDGADRPEVAVLTDGPGSPAYYEHCELAQRLGTEAITLGDLESDGDEVGRRDGDGRRRRVDVVYRRTDESRYSDAEGNLTPLGEKLGPAVAAGRLGVANGFGAGVGDDKLTHAYGERMVRFYLGEEPLLPSVRTLDLCEPDQRAEALERLEDLVVKQRHRAGGEGVIVEPEEEGLPDLEDLRHEIERHPERLVAQERVDISTHPTIAGDGFEPRRVDLRPYVLRAADGWTVLPGGLTRFAATPESLVVNSTQGGGGKDTWVLG